MSEIKQNKRLRISLRAKFALVMSIIIILVSSIIVYVTVDLIFNDKKAYIHESVYSTINTSADIVQRFLSSKKSSAHIAKKLTENELGESEYLKSDTDLYKIRTLSFSDENGIFEETLYENKNLKKHYRNNVEFLNLPPKRELISLYSIVKEKKSYDKVIYSKGKAPHYFVMFYSEASDKVIILDFLIDNLMQSVFSNGAYEFALVKSNGDILYHNRPDNLNDNYQSFYAKTLFKAEAEKHKSTKVMQAQVSGEDYILGYRKIKGETDYYIVSGLANSKAYDVTRVLAFRMIMFAFGLVVLFNIFAIFLADRVMKPLKILIQGIETISRGNFNFKVQVSSNDEISDLSDAFNSMGQRMQDNNLRILEYNRTLELKVEERTVELNDLNRFIKAMINSLSQGLLVFDKSGFCLDIHTKACEQIFNHEPRGRHIGQLINAPDKVVLNDWVENLFLEMIPFESLVELGLKSVPSELSYDDSNFKHISLEYFPMRDNDDKVVNVVMVANDKTKEYVSDIELRSERDYVKFVMKVISNKENFLSFKETFNSDIEREIQNIKNPSAFSKDELMRTLHSLKGGTALFNLNHVSSKIHNLETDVLGSVDIGEKIISDLKDVKRYFHNAVTKLDDMIGLSTIESDNRGTTGKQIEEILKICKAHDPELEQEIIDLLKTKEVRSFIEPYLEMSKKLSERLGKKIKDIKVENGDIRVDSNYYKAFFQSCIHLFNNSIDHGIESPSKRAESSKDEAGQLSLIFKVIGESEKLIFQIKDDGGGIPVSRIRKKMEKLGYSETDVYKDEKEILLHIFDSALSSNDEVTNVSGRGVGLYDIKKTVEDMNGEISVESELGQGTTFTFTLPFV